MAVGVTVELKGLQAALAALDGLKKTHRNKIIRPAVTAASQMVLKSARANVPREAGLLKRSLIKKIKTYKSGKIIGIIGPKRGMKQTVHRKGALWGKGGNVTSDPANYAHLVEKGTQPHMIGIFAHPGSRPQPFLVPALEENREAIVSLMTARLREGLAAYHVKAAKGK